MGAAGRYISWSDVVARYPSVEKVGGGQEVGSHFIHYAEAEVDALLSPGGFTVPFSSNNVTAKSLAIDITYVLSNPLRDPDHLNVVKDRIDGTIADLLAGKRGMAVTSGSPIFASKVGAGAWSTTMNYAPTFGVGKSEEFAVDSGQLWNEEQARS